MALHVCENINEDLFVIINKLFSTKYPIDVFDVTKKFKKYNFITLLLKI